MKMPFLKKIFYILFVIVVLFLGFIFIIEPKKCVVNFADFGSVSGLKKYASHHAEYVASDNSDWANPVYQRFYISEFGDSILHKVFKKIKQTLGFEPKPEWNHCEFAELLSKVYVVNSKRISVKKDDKIFIWGDLHGALHSFVRDLEELEKRSVIGDDLVIKDKNTRIVFLGDLVSRSPYTLETLHVALQLMKKNPGQVLYTRGNHETSGHWQGFNMINALSWRIGGGHKASVSGIPLVKEINQFFEKLPSSLMIDVQGSKEKIYCAYDMEMDDRKNEFNVKLVFRGEERSEVLGGTKGLVFLGHQIDYAQWSLISCPTEIYKKFFKFTKDSFAELLIEKSVSESVLIHNYREAASSDKFTEEFYNPVFGYRLKSKKNDMSGKKIVNVGTTLSLSGVTGPLGRENKIGLDSALLGINKEDSDRLVRFVALDDNYEPRLALANIRKLINEYQTKIILAPTGTPTLSFYLDMVKANEVSVFFPYTGGVQFRQSDIKNIIHFRASYSQEVEKSLPYLIERHGLRSFAFFYQNDSYGKPIVEMAHKILRKYGITKWLDLPHVKTESDFSRHVKEINKFMPDVIGFFCSQFPATELASQLGVGFFLRRMIFGVSFAFSGAFEKFLNDRGIKFVLSSVVPPIEFSDIPIIKEHEEIMAKLGRRTTLQTIEGYISGCLLVDAIRNCELPITREKLMAYFEKLKDYNFKGLNLSFDPNSRQIFQNVWLRSMNEKWLRE